MDADLTTCPGCSCPITPGWLFCESCGRPVAAGRDAPRTLASLLGETHRELDLGVVAGGTDVGLVRPRNEDAVAIGALGDHAAAVVCDGVSSVPGSDRAAVRAATTGIGNLLARLADGADGTGASGAAGLAAAVAVAGLGTADDTDSPCCTYVSALVTPTDVVVSWLGDSRAYWIGDGEPRALTVDDSRAGRLLDAGVPATDPRMTDPAAYALERWLGADVGPVRPRTEVYRPDRAGLVLVCSDGLSRYLDMGVLRAPASGRPLEVVRDLLEHTLALGAHDNVSVAVLPYAPNHQEHR